MEALLTPIVLGLALFARHAEGANSSGCVLGTAVQAGQTSNVTLGEDRWYLLYFPEKYVPDQAAPLILSYHGGNRNASEQQELDLLSDPFFNSDHIVVYPNGIDETWQGVPGVSTDDIGFSAAILDDIESRYCVDTNRIYATGKSQGGGFVGVLACDDSLSKRVAAFAPVSGAFYVNTTGGSCNPNTIIYNPAVEPAKNCTPGRAKIPVLEFHGLVDGTIAYEGGVRRKACLPAIPHWIQGWAEYDDLGETNVSSKVPGATDGSTAVRYEFGKDGEQGLVTHIMDGNNIGHDWPSTLPNDDSVRQGDPPATFNASSIILDFFAAHPLT